MRLLLFSDLHCDRAAARRLVERAANADVVVGAGDFASVRRGIETTIEVLRAIERPAVLVPGNNETLDELRTATNGWDGAHVLHGDGVVLDGVPFFGLGGGVPITPFGSWSYDFSDEEATKLLASCPDGAVLVSHSPPKGAGDLDGQGRSLGSHAVRDATLLKRPRLVVCGHIHASAGGDVLLGETPVVNAGPGGVEWTLEDRAAIVGDLMESLGPPDPAAGLSHEQWLSRVDNRVQAALEGREGVSWEEARAQIDARLNRK